MLMDSESFIEFLLSRRSIRKFKKDFPSLDLVKRILDVARYAPSAGNRQPWIFIIVTDPEVKSRLAKIHRWAYPLEEAPIGVVIACNKDTSPDSYLVDCANAAMYVMLAAHAFGLGTVWIQSLRNIEDIQNILNLPNSYIPVSIIAMGYPAETPYPRARKELKEITYINLYGNPLQ